MTKDDVLKLAIEADLVEPRDISNDVCGLPEAYVDSLVAFARLVAAHETEACAKLCHAYAQTAFNSSSQNAAVELRDAIWARRQG
jgi:hypothetical protein